MSSVGFCSVVEKERVHITSMILHPEFSTSTMQLEDFLKSAPPSTMLGLRQEGNKISLASSCVHNDIQVLEQPQTSVEDTPPLSRQFWKAGTYDNVPTRRSQILNQKNSLRVHPKFLHSNATSHKWAFGAFAELLDNAVDEVQNGATFVSLDAISNARDQSPALLIQDDGGGMDPASVRRCMSFGFSDKTSGSAIGRYGNGFKTSTMRLGADVIVFTRRMKDRMLTQSIGLLSYTYLSRMGLDRIVVPLIDYEYISSKLTWVPLYLNGSENFELNLSIILQWSPYLTEAELLKQFDDIGAHGTKVVIYNLWFSDDETLELNFNSDPEDIRLEGSLATSTLYAGNRFSKLLMQHIGDQYHYSLRVYLSILYLRLPENFSIILRGKVVEHHCIARDLKFPELIVYRPQSGVGMEDKVITTIGFLKEAPNVNIHGFNVYHKNRLILPFWQVVSYTINRGRGVVGVLEANFVEPIHNKQDFERTSAFQKLEARLKQMTGEYWDHHCGLIGYQLQKHPRASGSSPPSSVEPVRLTDCSNSSPVYQASPGSLHAGCRLESSPSHVTKRGGGRAHSILSVHNTKRKQVCIVDNVIRDSSLMENQHVASASNQKNEDISVLMEVNKKLHGRCSLHEKRQEELKCKVVQLTTELEEGKHEYERMYAEMLNLEAEFGTYFLSAYHRKREKGEDITSFNIEGSRSQFGIAGSM